MTEEDVRRAVSVLSRAGVVAAATETFFGLLADARRPDAVDRVFALKGRHTGKGVALLLPNRLAWRPLVTEIPPIAERLADRFWPGPLTIALPANASVDPRLQVEGTVAARWPGPSDAASIVEAFGSPLTATSANLAGDPPTETDSDVAVAFAHAISSGNLFVITGRAPGGAPSTLIAVAGERVRLVRRGAISKSDLTDIVPEGALG